MTREHHQAIRATALWLVLCLTLPCCYSVLQSCNQLYTWGLRSDGVYTIDPDGPDGLPHFDVVCKFTANPIQTIIHHNQENEIRCKGYYMFTFVQLMVYGALSHDQVRSVTQASTACSYRMKLYCAESTMHDNGWKDYYGVRTKMISSVGTMGGWECQGLATLTNFTGTITEIDKFPIKETQWGDTDDAGEELYYSIEPLVCTGEKNAAQIHTRNDFFKLAEENMKMSNQGVSVDLGSLCSVLRCSIKCLMTHGVLFQFSLATCQCEIFYRTTGTKVAVTGFNIYSV